MSECNKCGNNVVIGEWPWCPHGFGNNLDDPMQSYVDWQLTSETGGVEITTRGQRRAIMMEKGFEFHKNRFEGSVGEGRRQYFDQGKK